MTNNPQIILDPSLPYPKCHYCGKNLGHAIRNGMIHKKFTVENVACKKLFFFHTDCKKKYFETKN